MTIELPYENPPQAQIIFPSELDKINGCPKTVVILTADDCDGIVEAWGELCEMMGWTERSA